ncbi:MAG TPA: DUF1801 domain-containing protein [Pyrinomonadaceae bacterium]|nr:DUF1801 domain-containing protein [Pyrinomonadaceae bacterium]
MTTKRVRSASANDVDRYIGSLPEESRTALESLRKVVRAIVPDAVETISYGMPTFKLNNRMLVSYAGFKDHCSFFPGAAPIETHKDELKNFPTSKGTIRFTPERPLSAALVKKLVKTRIRLNEAQTKSRSGSM